MGAKAQALRPLLDARTLRALWHFDRDFAAYRFNMFDACQAFFERAGYRVRIERGWEPPAGGVIFFADHVSPLDGFAMSLACPRERQLKRTIFLVTGLCLGRNVFRHNIMVWPKGSYRGIVQRARGVIPRLFYLMTHRWGPWVRPNRALNRMRETIADGTSIAILPSGEIGQRRWRSGLGALIIELARRRDELTQAPHLAPVYIDWDEHKRSVSVRAPALVPLDSLYDKALHADGREPFADWLADQYYHHSWAGDSSRSMRPRAEDCEFAPFVY